MPIKAISGAVTQRLIDDSMADALHRHSELSASDGTPNPAMVVDATGQVGIGIDVPSTKLDVNGDIWSNPQEASANASFHFRNNGAYRGSFGYIAATGNIWIGTSGNGITGLSVNEATLGLNTIAPGRTLDINVGAATGGIRITYNDADGAAANYVDLLVDSAGKLTITPTGAAVILGGGLILPSSDPLVAGAWWDNAGTLTKSTGS